MFPQTEGSDSTKNCHRNNSDVESAQNTIQDRLQRYIQSQQNLCSSITDLDIQQGSKREQATKVALYAAELVKEAAKATVDILNTVSSYPSQGNGPRSDSMPPVYIKNKQRGNGKTRGRKNKSTSGYGRKTLPLSGETSLIFNKDEGSVEKSDDDLCIVNNAFVRSLTYLSVEGNPNKTDGEEVDSSSVGWTKDYSGMNLLVEAATLLLQQENQNGSQEEKTKSDSDDAPSFCSLKRHGSNGEIVSSSSKRHQSNKSYTTEVQVSSIPESLYCPYHECNQLAAMDLINIHKHIHECHNVVHPRFIKEKSPHEYIFKDPLTGKTINFNADCKNLLKDDDKIALVSKKLVNRELYCPYKHCVRRPGYDKVQLYCHIRKEHYPSFPRLSRIEAGCGVPIIFKTPSGQVFRFDQESSRNLLNCDQRISVWIKRYSAKKHAFILQEIAK
ncbi:hypothetical protein BDA99DRAFT_503048 [Phascolomyces articulosus]|uniref:Uncharacterized protein n=1 Tax=Phascolomyces articulosus TaxID=60185 RepID=A0AAD5PGA0_9FUNG|nr:hypothetical protein BDA99DRAFT_503048 [Phascolomyces articulosus]